MILCSFGCRGGIGRPRLGCEPRLFALVLHELPSERAFCLKLIVAAASQTHGFHRRPAPTRHRLNVIVFEHCARRATLTGLADERASPTISLPHRALDRRGNVSFPRRLAPLGAAWAVG